MSTLNKAQALSPHSDLLDQKESVAVAMTEENEETHSLSTQHSRPAGNATKQSGEGGSEKG